MSAAVIALPTAAPKKVRQSPSRTRRADRKALLRFPDVRKTARERAQDSRIALALEADLPSFALIIAGLGRVLDKRQQRNLAMYLAVHADQTGGREAAAWFETFVTDPARSFEGGE